LTGGERPIAALVLPGGQPFRERLRHAIGNDKKALSPIFEERINATPVEAVNLCHVRMRRQIHQEPRFGNKVFGRPGSVVHIHKAGLEEFDSVVSINRSFHETFAGLLRRRFKVTLLNQI
jgi:hypothetical protein